MRECQFAKRAKPPGRVVHLAGQRFGYLTVLSRKGRIGRNAAWLCRCDCGAERAVSSGKLRSNRVKSCNINGHRFVAQKFPSLRQQFPSEYMSWQKMHQRCNNKDNHRFPHYGARGIKVCDRWFSFENFMTDMGIKLDSKFTIERKNVNQNYEPGNCEWIPRSEQGRNRTDTIFITYEGRRMKLIDLVGELGLSRGIVYGRLKLGWPLDAALAVPIRSYKK